MKLTHDETVGILDIKDNAGATIGGTLTPEISENVDNNLILTSLLPNGAKVKITIDDV